MKPVVRATVQCEKCYGKRCLWKSRERNGKPKNPKTNSNNRRSRQKPAASAKKIETKRRKALKSNRPRTEIGKKTMARKGLKQGVFSKWLLIPHPYGKGEPT